MMSNSQTKQSLRHCMVVHNYYPFAETRVQRQAEALINNGHQVDVICLHHAQEPKTEVVAGVNVHRLPLRRKKSGPILQLLDYLAFFIASFIKLSALHLHQKYDVVQVHNLPDFLVFVALVPKLTGSGVVLDIHDLMPEFYCAKFKGTMNSLPVRLLCWQEWLSCRFADHVITVTEGWRKTLIERGVPAEKCTVVMNVADPRYFNDQVVEDCPKQNDSYFRLIYHGTLTQRYGVDLALRAVAQARDKFPDIQLTIHGRGEYLEVVRHLIDELALEDCVHLSTSFLPISELPKLIKSGHVGLVPYRRDVFTDGILPTKLMEYTALGVPAIASRTPGITDYFDESMVEFCVPESVDDLARCICRLGDNRERLNDLANNARRFNQTYNWTTQAAKYGGLIEKLAKKHQVAAQLSRSDRA